MCKSLFIQSPFCGPERTGSCPGIEDEKGEGSVTEKQKMILSNILAFVYEKAHWLKGKEIEMVRSIKLRKRWSISFSVGVNNR